MGNTCNKTTDTTDQAMEKECTVMLRGLIKPGFKLKDGIIQVPLTLPAFCKMKKHEKQFMDAYDVSGKTIPKVTIKDARPLQEQAGSPAAWFKEHGFALL